MASIGSSNPVLAAFEKPQPYGNLEQADTQRKVMTIGGTVNASAILIALVAASAVGAWHLIANGAVPMMPLWLGGLIVGLFLALVIAFVPKTAPFLAPVYAVVEGAFLGAVSLYVSNLLNARAEGLIGTQTVFQAVVLTFGVFAAMLMAYKFGVIRGGPIFNRVIVAMTGGYMLFVIVALLLSWVFGNDSLSSLFSFTNGSALSIGLSVFVCALAAFNLIVDFDFIERGAQQQLPKHMEWYGAFALTVTLVWLYINILRLLAKIRSSD